MLIDEMKAEPWRFDFYHVLRQIERAHADRPRIGDSAARREEYVDLGQDPYLEFPASNLASVTEEDGRLRIIVKFLGLLGPQGALPLATTDESLGWLLMRDANRDVTLYGKTPFWTGGVIMLIAFILALTLHSSKASAPEMEETAVQQEG